MLGNLNLLHNLSERRTISRSVLSANTDLLSSLTLYQLVNSGHIHQVPQLAIKTCQMMCKLKDIIQYIPLQLNKSQDYPDKL